MKIDGDLLFSAGKDNLIRAYNFSNGECYKLLGHD